MARAPATADENGGILIAVLAVMAVGLSILMYTKNQVDELMAVTQSNAMRTDRAALAEQLQLSIDCSRTLPGYSATTRCPAGTDVDIHLVDQATVDTSGPGGSLPLGQGWYAKAFCGTNDVRVNLARRNAAGNWQVDPLTKKVADLTDASTQISDRTNGIDLCGPWFGVGQANARVIGMSILTQQKEGAEHTTADGELNATGGTCDAMLGRLAMMDDVPLPGIYCHKGPSGCPTPSSYTTFLLGRYVPTYVPPSYVGPLQPTWPAVPAFARLFGTTWCSRICDERGFETGRQIRCDNTRPATPLGAIYDDATHTQVICLCLK